jgi:hypothetical protein
MTWCPLAISKAVSAVPPRPHWVASVREVVVLLQTPAVPGICRAWGPDELQTPFASQKFSYSRSRLPAVPAPEGPFDPRDWWLRQGAAGPGVLSRPGQPGHGGAAVAHSQPAMIVGGQLAGGRSGASGLICCERGGSPHPGCSPACPHPQMIHGPYPAAGRLAAHQGHLPLPGRASGTTFRTTPGGEAP